MFDCCNWYSNIIITSESHSFSNYRSECDNKYIKTGKVYGSFTTRCLFYPIFIRNHSYYPEYHG